MNFHSFHCVSVHRSSSICSTLSHDGKSEYSVDDDLDGYVDDHQISTTFQGAYPHPLSAGTIELLIFLSHKWDMDSFPGGYTP